MTLLMSKLRFRSFDWQQHDNKSEERGYRSIKYFLSSELQGAGYRYVVAAAYFTPVYDQLVSLVVKA